MLENLSNSKLLSCNRFLSSVVSVSDVRASILECIGSHNCFVWFNAAITLLLFCFLIFILLPSNLTVAPTSKAFNVSLNRVDVCFRSFRDLLSLSLSKYNNSFVNFC